MKLPALASTFFNYYITYLLLSPSPPPPHTQPVVVSYDPEEGARLAKNTAVANLPYMHRNPAV